MKNHVLTVFLFCFALCSCFAQNQDPSVEPEIEMKAGLLGYRFFKDGERLNWKELLEATASVEEANMLIKKGKSQNTFSTVFAFTGGALIGIPLSKNQLTATLHGNSLILVEHWVLQPFIYRLRHLTISTKVWTVITSLWLKNQVIDSSQSFLY